PTRRPPLPKLRRKEPALKGSVSPRSLRWRRARAPTPAREPHDPVGVARRSLFTECVLVWGRREQGPLSNPVFRREIRSELHGGAHYWGSIFVVTSFSGVIAVFATSESHGLRRGIAFLGLAIASLLVPPIAAASFPREREGESFDLLASTPLSAGTLVAGKFHSALHAASPVAMACLLVLVAFFPITFPGLEFQSGILSLLPALWDLALVLLAALSAVSFNIALSLFFSARSSRTLPAMGLAYMAFLAIQLLPVLAGWFVPPAWAVMVLPVVNPFLAILVTQAPNPAGVPHEILCAALHAAGTLVAIRAASASLEKRLRAP
ncbi:MAG TPA: hypothetical protein VMT52_12130, partial [Planctomycetota bacterium]|nr:hypothetical protein [Planctomycetota bacterium]